MLGMTRTLPFGTGRRDDPRREGQHTGVRPGDMPEREVSNPPTPRPTSGAPKVGFES